MKALLLQDEIYLPSYGGGIKANRLLLEKLAQKGHSCAAIAPALTGARTGPNHQMAFMSEMSARKIIVSAPEPHLFRFKCNGVQVDAVNFPSTEERRRHIARAIREFQPDWVIVNDDKRRFLLDSALRSAPGRVILLLQTIIQLPFGPLSVQESEFQANLMREARAIIVISDYLKEYLRSYGNLESHKIHLPVFGDGPYPFATRFDSGFVTLINPCDLKGLPIFLDLAKRFDRTEFAAVPTWGADDSVLEQLRRHPNIRILTPSDEIDDILSQTRILMAPSLWPETFGYVVTEAMLRGIPTLASDIGGLPEAKLGVDYLLPVSPASRDGERFVVPAQDSEPWAAALNDLISDRDHYERISRESRASALSFVAKTDVSYFESFLSNLG